MADAAGNYLYDASGVLAQVNIADRPYFTRLRDDASAGLVISRPLLSRITGRVVIVFARRLEDRAGHFAGIVLATLDASYFENYYRELEVGPHGSIAMWSRDLELFSRAPKLAGKPGVRLSNDAIRSRLLAGREAGTFRSIGELDGEPRIFAFRAVEGLPFIVSVGLAEQDIFAEWRQRVAIYGVLGSVLIVVLFALLRFWLHGYRRAEAIAESMTRAYAEKSQEARALLDSIPYPAWLLDKEACFLAINEAFCRYTAMSMEQILGRTVADIFSPDEVRQLREGQLEAYEKGSPVRQLLWLVLNGQRRPFEFLRVPVLDDKGRIKGLAGVAWDMSERFAAEERQRLITHFFDHGSDAVLILDKARRILTLNQAVTAISGYQLDDLRGRLPRIVLDARQDSAVIAAMLQALETQQNWRGELLAVRKDGSPLFVHCNVSAIRDEAGEVANWAVFVADLSERKAAEARIESLTHVDQLTGLPNRQGFSRILGEWLARGQAGALIVIDLDQLGRINDAFGHAAGDGLLCWLAALLRNHLREDDALARLGGDRFAFLLHLDSLSVAVEVFARKLLDSVVQPIRIEGSDVVPTASAGICLLGADGEDVATVLRNVDAALHQAKALGQNVFRFFAAEMNQRMAEHLRLESDLRGALGRSELSLHYQPQVDLRTGEIIAFESLLRWQHPELGMVSPDRFIPLAEESRLILPIGEWVLEEACRQNKAWQDAGMAPKVVAVNLSAVQFHSADVVATVARVLASSGLAPCYLELEITESVIVEDPERVVQVMAALKAIGVSLSIDDFGTGYSSLTYLKRFPIDKIKIDRSFVRDLASNSNDAAIIRMIIGIAAELQRKVIAEGVETREQLDFLWHHQCDEYQGYFCSQPMPAAAVPAWLAGRQS